MIKILRKNNKKILAVIGVFLMIAFIVPNIAKQGGPGSAKEVLAYSGDEKITGLQFQQAGQQWDLLTRGLVFRNPMFGFEQSLPMYMIQDRLMQAMPREQMYMGMQQALEASFRIVREIEPMHYLLLLREADQMNVVVPDEMVDGLYKSLSEQLPTVARNDEQFVKLTLRNWLRVLAAFDRVADSVKISPALAYHELAARGQEVALKLVQFNAEQFKAQIPAPTTEQLQGFFEKYRNVDAGTGEFGFGYRYPNRARFQSIRIPLDKVKETITGEEMYEYYLANTDQFQTTPSTQPTTQPGTQPAATQPVAELPTTRPWEALTNVDKDDIRRTLAGQRAALIAKTVQQRFSTDWPDFRQAAREAGKPVPEKATNTSLGVPYPSYSYLLRMQQFIQGHKESRKVLPELWEEGVLRTPAELAQLPGIGKSFWADGRQRIEFPSYATQLAESLMTEQQQQKAREAQLQPLLLYQASPILQDPDGNLYIFRLTGAEAAHAPASLDPVAEKARQDYVIHQAYLKAQEAAKQLAEQAKKLGLADAAKAVQGAEVITTDLFANTPNVQVDKVKLPAGSVPQFVQQSFDLLRERLRTGTENPVGVIQLPQTQTVMVAQLAQAKPAEKDSGFDTQVMFLQHQMRSMRAASMMPGWFDPQSIEQRMNFRRAEAPARQQQPAAPGRPPVIPGQ